MKSSTYDDSSGMPATPEKALCGNVSAKDGAMDYRRMLEDGYKETSNFSGMMSRLEFLSDYIFDFTTYDGEMSELFAKKALEVCAAISNGTTFDYIKDADNYRWFLWLCNTPFLVSRLEWGTSIRGAWWDLHGTELSTCGLWSGGMQITEPLTFNEKQWRAFIAALIAFAAADA
jgi:hypothetical protein